MDTNTPPAQGLIDPDAETDVKQWAERFGVGVDDLMDALRTVGNEAEKVQQFLAGGGNRVP